MSSTHNGASFGRACVAAAAIISQTPVVVPVSRVVKGSCGLIEVPSPCVGICWLEPETGLCTGCMRTGDEIAAWPLADEDERLAILERLKQRRRACGRTSAADSRPRRRTRRSAEASAPPAVTTAPPAPASGSRRASAGELLRGLLEAKSLLLADGAMGTSLFRLGLMSGDSPELWNVEHPDRVAQVHRGFVEAGSDIVLTNSFGANRHRLALHGAQDRVGELNRAAAGIAHGVAEEAGRPVLVAGSMGPTGEIFAPIGRLDFADGEAAFAEQAEALAEGGCDLLWIETISAAEELEAAVAGAARAGLPIVATMSFDTNGRTMMGLRPEDAMALCTRLAVRPAAFGANCGIGPAQLIESVLGLARAAGPDDVIVAKGNGGVPQFVGGAVHYDGTPEVMAEYACLARAAGARIIGGCCGTTPVHVRAMATALEARPRGDVPDRTTIEARLGPIAVPEPRADAETTERRRRRRG